MCQQIPTTTPKGLGDLGYKNEVVSCGPGLALRSLRARDVVLWYLIWYCPSILGILVATLLS
jgi:hypothetical protein